MSRQNRIAVTRGGLTVRYRASPEPQIVDISLELDNPYPASQPMLDFEVLAKAVNLGAAGGSLLSPTAGAARIVAGPTDGENDLGPAWQWSLEIAGVCPQFWRHFVEDISLTGGGFVFPKAIAIVGQLPLDDSPLSLRENQLAAWLQGLDVWAGAWPQPPFRVIDVPQPAGASFRLRFSGPTSVDLMKQVEDLCELWCRLVSPLYRETGEPGFMQLAPQVVRSRHEVAVRYDLFKYDPKPPRDLLLNMLVRFHHDVAPLDAVELGFG